MTISKTAIIAVALSLASVGNAHMVMAKPVPYGSPNNSPLDASGSDFPCKVGGGGSGSYEVKTMNEWSVGSTQSLEFTGTAVHGGGSCQLSVTTDKEPKPSSVWKVIHSFEGGCPAATVGNLNEDGSSGGPGKFPFTVPEELPNGELTIAWTWFNKIGNREMYMNCAPVTVSGGSNDTSGLESLPDMAVANIAGQGDCHTSESNDYTFENPGKYVTKSGSGPYASLCGGASSPQPPSGPSYGPPPAFSDPATPSNPAIPSEPTAPIKSSVGAAPAPVSTQHTMFTVTAPVKPTPSGAPTSIAGPATPTGSCAAVKPTAAPAQPKAPVPAPGGTASNRTLCSPDGSLICNGESQFGICNWGKVVWQPVAAGTTCNDGKIARRAYTHRAQRTAI